MRWSIGFTADMHVLSCSDWCGLQETGYMSKVKLVEAFIGKASDMRKVRLRS
jgi:hypothetical protein